MIDYYNYNFYIKKDRGEGENRPEEGREGGRV